MIAQNVNDAIFFRQENGTHRSVNAAYNAYLTYESGVVVTVADAHLKRRENHLFVCFVFFLFYFVLKLTSMSTVCHSEIEGISKPAPGVCGL